MCRCRCFLTGTSDVEGFCLCVGGGFAVSEGVILRVARARLFSAENLLTRLLQVFSLEVDLVIYKKVDTYNENLFFHKVM